ncbi:phosphoenolpyruvate carboxylase [Limnobacter humi]|uniref:Phosphoenolpyruvate carboxylase n=1 Tax=Limnobacter humi TaxID=1778671 RepID=A0ABT1WIB2_9BURK|nr:phosphoenolpyruvate carboxylase [Limnobacter humi]MCQ8897259.1 phosphoenolpyruvate carboxylase [Limnobacter humi]
MPVSAFHPTVSSSRSANPWVDENPVGQNPVNSGQQSTMLDTHSLSHQCLPLFKQKAWAEGLSCGLNDTDMETLRSTLETLEHLDTQGDQPFPESLMRALQTSPKVLELALKTVNSQLLVKLVAEQHIKAQRLNGPAKLQRGLTTFSEHSTSTDSVNSLEQVMVRPVITGHPTSLNKPEAIQSALTRIESMDLLPGEIAQLCDEVWAGQGQRTQKPTVQQEAAYFQPMVKALLNSSHKIHKLVHKTTDNLGMAAPTKNLFELGNWVAGDRDGNPTISASDLMNVVSQYSRAAFDFYLKKLNGTDADGEYQRPSSLRVLLTAAGQESRLNALIDQVRNTDYRLNDPDKFDPQKPHFQSARALDAALQDFDLSTLDMEDQSRAQSKLLRLSQDIQTMGFFGTTTDIRQNSAMNQKTVAEILKQNNVEANYLNLTEEERCHVLLTALDESNRLDAPLNTTLSTSDFASEMALIKAYKAIQDQYGEGALKNCITANSESASDMLEVMLLLKVAGLIDQRGLHMNVMPLIETVDDLKHAEPMLKQVLNMPWYTDRLPLANPNDPDSPRVQHVMVGYSDSNRLDGPLASSWAVHKAVTSMTRLAKQHGLALQVFHGRGGTEARGSGHSYEQDIEYLNGESLAMGLRQTEQGEEVPLKFGNRALSTANLMDMLGTTLRVASKGADQGVDQFKAVMDSLADTANQRYKQLYEHPQLAHFFRKTTPIQYMGLSNAGSRPASRKVANNDQEYLEQMRAIPWTAAWYQSGSMMPAYFGTGTALAAHVGLNPGGGRFNDGKLQELKTLYQQWPFFKNLIDRTDMALHKSDMAMARNYADLEPSAREVFELIDQEHQLASTMVGLIKEPQTSSAEELHAKQAVDDRAPLRRWAQQVQVGLLKQFNQTTNHERLEPLKPLLVMSMQANANGVGRFG